MPTKLGYCTRSAACSAVSVARTVSSASTPSPVAMTSMAIRRPSPKVRSTAIVSGCTRVGDRDAVATGRLDGDHHRLGGCGGAVVERGVGDVEPGQRADHRLEFEDGLQGPLRRLGLVRRVRRVELGAGDGAADDRRAEPAVDAGAEEAVVGAQRSVARGEPLELGDQVLLGERRREVDARVAQGGRNRGEQVRVRRRPDRIEHLATFGIGVGEIRHAQSMPGRGRRPGARGPPRGSAPEVCSAEPLVDCR